MTPKLLSHLETDVPDTNSNVLGIADSEIDVADIRTIRNPDAKMISRNKIARWITGDNLDKMQSYLTERQAIGWRV